MFDKPVRAQRKDFELWEIRLLPDRDLKQEFSNVGKGYIHNDRLLIYR